MTTTADPVGSTPGHTNQPAGAILFDDIRVGMTMSTNATYDVTKEEIVEVAGRWDPQPFHLDEITAEGTDFKGLVASGLHTLAASVWLATLEQPATAAVAGLGMDRLRMCHPVRPGDRLHQTTEVVEVRPSRSRPNRGIVRARRTVHNQDSVVVLTYFVTWMVERAP